MGSSILSKRCFGIEQMYMRNIQYVSTFSTSQRDRIEKNSDSGGIRTHASEETGALNQRLRPLGHAILLIELLVLIFSLRQLFRTSSDK